MWERRDPGWGREKEANGLYWQQCFVWRFHFLNSTKRRPIINQWLVILRFNFFNVSLGTHVDRNLAQWMRRTNSNSKVFPEPIVSNFDFYGNIMATSLSGLSIEPSWAARGSENYTLTGFVIIISYLKIELPPSYLNKLKSSVWGLVALSTSNIY